MEGFTTGEALPRFTQTPPFTMSNTYDQRIKALKDTLGQKVRIAFCRSIVGDLWRHCTDRELAEFAGVTPYAIRHYREEVGGKKYRVDDTFCDRVVRRFRNGFRNGVLRVSRYVAQVTHCGRAYIIADGRLVESFSYRDIDKARARCVRYLRVMLHATMVLGSDTYIRPTL